MTIESPSFDGMRRRTLPHRSHGEHDALYGEEFVDGVGYRYSEPLDGDVLGVYTEVAAAPAETAKPVTLPPAAPPQTGA